MGEGKNGVVVVVACMDHRLVQLLEILDNPKRNVQQKMHDLEKILPPGNASHMNFSRLLDATDTSQYNIIVLANPGANVYGLKGTLLDIAAKHGKIHAVLGLSHHSDGYVEEGDCGGRKTVDALLCGRIPKTDPDYADLYEYFKIDTYKQKLEERGISADEFKRLDSKKRLERIDEISIELFTEAVKEIFSGASKEIPSVQIFSVITDHIDSSKSRHEYCITAKKGYETEIPGRLGRSMKIHFIICEPEPWGYSKRAHTPHKLKVA